MYDLWRMEVCESIQYGGTIRGFINVSKQILLVLMTRHLLYLLLVSLFLWIIFLIIFSIFFAVLNSIQARLFLWYSWWWLRKSLWLSNLKRTNGYNGLMYYPSVYFFILTLNKLWKNIIYFNVFSNIFEIKMPKNESWIKLYGEGRKIFDTKLPCLVDLCILILY